MPQRPPYNFPPLRIHQSRFLFLFLFRFLAVRRGGHLEPIGGGIGLVPLELALRGFGEGFFGGGAVGRAEERVERVGRGEVGDFLAADQGGEVGGGGDGGEGEGHFFFLFFFSLFSFFFFPFFWGGGD